MQLWSHVEACGMSEIPIARGTIRFDREGRIVSVTVHLPFTVADGVWESGEMSDFRESDQGDREPSPLPIEIMIRRVVDRPGFESA